MSHLSAVPVRREEGTGCRAQGGDSKGIWLAERGKTWLEKAMEGPGMMAPSCNPNSWEATAVL